MTACSKPRVVLAALGLVPSVGGTARSLQYFKNALDADVVSFTDAARLEAEGSAVPGAVHVPIKHNLAGRWFCWASRAAKRQADLLAAQADLLSCHVLYRYHAHWIGGWSRRRHIPYWVVPHGCLDPYVFTYRVAVKTLWMSLYGHRFLRGAAHVIFSTEPERRKASVRYAGPNCRVVRWPVAPLDLNGAEELRMGLRRRLGIKEHERLLLYLGRLHELKRPLELVAAAAEPMRNGVHLAIVGPDETVTAGQLRAAGQRHGIQHRLHIPGPAYGRSKEEWLHACDGFVSLSQRENFGHSAAEALSAGKAVILSPGNDLSEELAPHKCGWFLADDRLDTASAAIREWADLPVEQLQARGRNGQRFVRCELTFEKFAAELCALAAEALAPLHEPARPNAER